MKILILGSGGVGGYFGAKLAISGADVSFVARGKHFHSISKKGLRLQSSLGNIIIKQTSLTWPEINLINRSLCFGLNVLPLGDLGEITLEKRKK